MNFDEVIQLQVLKQKAMESGRGGFLTDQILDANPELPEIRQMCAKVSAVMYSELENVCGFLDMSKREFIESAVSDALNRAKEIIEKSGLNKGV